MTTTKARLRRFAAASSICALALALTSCSDGGTADTSSGGLTEVTFVEGLDVFPYELVTVAIEAGLFEDQGIDAKVIHTENEIQAIASQSADFAIGGTMAVLQARSKGVDVTSILATMDGLGMNTAYSNELVDSADVTQDAPLEKRVRALEGKTIGLTGPLGDDEVFFRYFLSEAGLDPDKDVKFSYIGGTSDRIAAMDEGQIDAYMSSIPAAELAVDRGVGQRMIVPTEEDVPGLDGIPYSGVHTTQRFIDENPETVKAVGQGLSAAANFMRDNPERTIAIVAEAYPDLSKKVVRSGMKAVMQAVPEDGKMTQEGWDKLVQAGAASGVVEEDTDASEGSTWTNEFLD